MIKNYIDGNKFKLLADIYVDEDKDYFTRDELNSKSKIIFVKGDWVAEFKQKIFPNINHKFKLITHNADTSVPNPNIDLLEDDRVIHWYGMNANYKHFKFTTVPIGIANDKWPHGNKQILQNIIDKNNIKDKLIYCNFDFNTNPYRYQIYEIIKNKEFINFDFTKTVPCDYWNKLSQYKYTVSPPGNSVDCHRVWEAIYLGVVPIIEKHSAMEQFYDLPILVIENWQDLNVDFLEKQYTIIKNRSNEKAYFNYYRDLINDTR